MANILIVTNLYPTKLNPQRGTFVEEQVESLRMQLGKMSTISVYFIDGKKSKSNYLKSMFYLPYLIKKLQINVVHAHYGLTLIPLLFVSTPIVVTYHGSDILRFPGNIVTKLLFWKAVKTIVVSQNLKDKLGFGTILPCGIKSSLFTLPSDSGYRKKGRLKILFPANPEVEIKNFPFFQDICRSLRHKGILVEEFYLTGIPRQYVPRMFWECDCMILTSFSEGSPTVIKEAIAAKLPFVSVNVGDVYKWTELISFGKVCNSYDADKMAQVVIELMNKITDRHKLDNRNAVKKYELNNISNEIIEIYKHICEH